MSWVHSGRRRGTQPSAFRIDNVTKKVKPKKTSTRTASKKKKTKRAAATAPGKVKTASRVAVAKKKTAKAKKVARGPAKAAARVAGARTVKSRPAAKSTSATTAAEKTTKNTRPQAATTQDPIQFVEEVKRMPKTYLTAKELREFKELLLAKRAELCGDVEHLTSEALNHKGGGRGEHSAMPIHMADLGSDNWEQEFTLGLIASEKAIVRDIDDACARIQKKTYGICVATHKPISKARLRAKPWAKYCIEYARAREEGRAF